MASKNNLPSVDWSAGHGPVGETVNLAALTAAGGIGLDFVGNMADLSAVGSIGWAAGGAAACALCSAAAAKLDNLASATIRYRLAKWAGAGAWVSWVGATTPWQWEAWAALGIGTAAAGMLAPKLSKQTRSAADELRPRRMLTGDESAKVGERWRIRLLRVAKIRVPGVRVEPWENGCGYSLDFALPQGGGAKKRIMLKLDDLAEDAGLPNGCGVEPLPGANRGAMRLDVSTVDVLAEEVAFPLEDLSPRSIADPFRLGLYRNGSMALVKLLWEKLLITGRPGGGKSNLLNVIMACLARCVDVLTWTIDPNGGRLIRPWIRPWVKGQAAAPGIDYAAVNDPQALDLTEALLRIIDARGSYSTGDDDKLPIGPGMPAIVLVVDENEDAGNPQVAANIREIIRRGRGAGVFTVVCALRGTSESTGSTANKRHSGIKVAMNVSSKQEIVNTFEAAYGLSPADVPHVGSGLLQLAPAEAPRPTKLDRITPPMVAQIVTATAGYRPKLEDAAVRAAGRTYDQRWTATLTALQAQRPTDQPEPAAPTSTVQRGLDALAKIKAGRSGRGQRPAQESPARNDPDFERVLREGGLGINWTGDEARLAAGPTLPKPTRRDITGPRARLLELLRQAGRAGWTVDQAFAAMSAELGAASPSRATVGRYLSQDAVKAPGGTGFVHPDWAGS